MQKLPERNFWEFLLFLLKANPLCPFNLKSGLVEFRQCADCVLNVLHTCRFVAGMHRKLRQTDIDGMDADLRVGKVSKGGTA